MSYQYSKWTVNLLKVKLSKRGAQVTGRKHELIEHLEAYDRNDYFRANTLQFSLYGGLDGSDGLYGSDGLFFG
jgi:hypothetical protein